jgi:hypothetical protein
VGEEPAHARRRDEVALALVQGQRALGMLDRLLDRGGVRVEFLLLYGALHVTLLIRPVSALLTVASTRWETR